MDPFTVWKPACLFSAHVVKLWCVRESIAPLPLARFSMKTVSLSHLTTCMAFVHRECLLAPIPTLPQTEVDLLLTLMSPAASKWWLYFTPPEALKSGLKFQTQKETPIFLNGCGPLCFSGEFAATIVVIYLHLSLQKMLKYLGIY